MIKIIKMINKYFSQEESDRRYKLRKIGNEIVEANDYHELVKLVKLYDKIKNENKAD